MPILPLTHEHDGRLEVTEGPDVTEGRSVTGTAPGEPVDERTTPVGYEIVFDCRDRMLGVGIVQRLEDAAEAGWLVERGEEGPTWSVDIRFPNQSDADRFFDSEFYRQLCIQARRSCGTAVLVVPLGPVDLA